MNISYLVTCHNEVAELERLLSQLYSAISKTDDEIVILDDFSDNEDTRRMLAFHPLFSTSSKLGRVIQHKLDNDFGTHKTFGSRQCTGDYIVQLDADEYLSQSLLENIHEIIESNPTVELYRLPRVNIVRNATTDDAKKWGWHITKLPEFGDLPVINWGNGDYQSRIYKNTEKIKWHKPLHETIVGASLVAHLPKEVDYAIIHDKTIERQRNQNEFYNKNWSVAANMGQG
jgi:glycosyltransferase involved in cell wall biosynthesis